MKIFLPGIRAVGFMPASALPSDIAMIARSGLPVPGLADIRWIELVGSGHTASVETQGVAGEAIQTASVSFRTSRTIPDSRPLAFVVVDQDDRAYVVGAAEPPYPVVRSVIDFGSPGSAAGISYSISHKAIRTLIPYICNLP